LTDRPPTADVERADPARLEALLDDLARIGADPDGGGVSRLALTQDERRAHTMVGDLLGELGLDVRQDAIGNTLATRAGARGGPALALGSHLDSVPRGGRFDGAAGVAAMVEVMRLLEANAEVTHHPILGVAFTGEEGARFGEPCIGSKAVVGIWDDRDLAAVHDANGVTMAAAMESLGLDPSRITEARWDQRRVAAFFELHIEQGRVLEQDGISIGLLDMVSGSTRMWLTLTGRADHSGATPMMDRRDALTAAAEIALTVEGIASDPFHRGTRATVGRLDVQPNSITTIPGAVRMSVDVRDVDGDRLRRTAATVVDQARSICKRRAIELDVEVIADTSPTVLSTWLRRIVRDACASLGLGNRVMSTGASHDAQIVARIVPSAMMLVPSRAGLSHVPEEWSSSTDVARGADLLYETILRVDRLLAALPDGSGLGEPERIG
jgi:hydantoinase/carbamoylase family amidase